MASCPAPPTGSSSGAVAAISESTQPGQTLPRAQPLQQQPAHKPQSGLTARQQGQQIKSAKAKAPPPQDGPQSGNRPSPSASNRRHPNLGLGQPRFANPTAAPSSSNVAESGAGEAQQRPDQSGDRPSQLQSASPTIRPKANATNSKQQNRASKPPLDPNENAKLPANGSTSAGSMVSSLFPTVLDLLWLRGR